MKNIFPIIRRTSIGIITFGMFLTLAMTQSVPNPNWLVFPQCNASSTYNGKPLPLTIYYNTHNNKILYVIPLKDKIVQGNLCIETTTGFIGILKPSDVKVQPGKMLVNPAAVPPATQEAVLNVQPTATGYTLTIRADKNVLICRVPKPLVVLPPITGNPPGPGTGNPPGPGTGSGPGLPSGLTVAKAPYTAANTEKNQDTLCSANATASAGSGGLSTDTKGKGNPPSNVGKRGEAFAWIEYTYTAPSSGVLTTQVLFTNVHAEGTAREATSSGAEVPNDYLATDTGYLYVRIKNNTTGQEKPKVESSLGRAPKTYTTTESQRLVSAQTINVNAGDSITVRAGVCHYSRGKLTGFAQGKTTATVQEFRLQMPSQTGKKK
jgi:hypothetical protein